MRVGLIGCGLIGQKRIRALGTNQLVVCADLIPERAQKIARSFNCQVALKWQTVTEHHDVDVIVIATTHDSLAEITLTAIDKGKHVLVEKPAARNVTELTPAVEAMVQRNVLVRVGFNHRYHRAFRRARTIIDQGELGELMFVRARYGHGGRVGYDKEWRANPKLSGGGELIDQGTHLIDLARWFLGDFSEIQGAAHTYFWEMPVDDNVFMTLQTPKRQVAFLHASCTEWKNIFSFEIYGRLGKLHVEGLGGSYGIERLTYYKMLPQMGPPETVIWEYPMEDDSWSVEFAEFMEDIKLKRQPSVSLCDAQSVLSVVEKIYKDSGYDYSA